MKDEDVGVAVKGDDLGFELVAQSGLDGEQTTYGEVLCVVVGGGGSGGGGGATIHGHLVFLRFGLVLDSKWADMFFKVQLQSQLCVNQFYHDS